MPGVRALGALVAAAAAAGNAFASRSLVEVGWFKRSEGPETKCCCRGPKLDTCRLLRNEELITSSDPRKWRSGRSFCPDDLGYSSLKRWGLELPNGIAPPFCEAEEKAGELNRYEGPVVTVRAYWIRHGWSCANALQDQGKVNFQGTEQQDSMWPWVQSKKFIFYEDPGLTDAAVLRAHKLGGPIRERILNETGGKRPLLFSSVMVRAMETAMHNFPGWTLRPIPFIAETGSTLDNKPLSWEEQKNSKLTREPNTPEELEALKFDVAPATHRDRSSGRKSSYSQFRNFLPGALQELLPAPAAGEEIPVVIVSHSGYMRDFLQCSEDGEKPRNNEVWVQKYTFRWDEWNASLENAGCQKFFPPDSFPNPPQRLCAGDVFRCSMRDGARKPNEWLRRDELFCSDLQNKSIIARDIQDELPYTQPGNQLYQA